MGRRASKLRETVESRRRSENTEDTSFSKPDGQPSWLGTASSRTFSHDFSRVPTMIPLKHVDGFARRNTRRYPVATEITMFAFQCERIEEKMQRNNTAYRKGSVRLSFSLILSLSLPRAVSLSFSNRRPDPLARMHRATIRVVLCCREYNERRIVFTWSQLFHV